MTQAPHTEIELPPLPLSDIGYFCNKCGAFPKASEHEGCNYFAGSFPRKSYSPTETQDYARAAILADRARGPVPAEVAKTLTITRELALETWGFLAQDCSPCMAPDCQIDGKNIGVDSLSHQWNEILSGRAMLATSPAPTQQPLTNEQIDAIVYQCRQNGNDDTYSIVRAAISAAPAPKEPLTDPKAKQLLREIHQRLHCEPWMAHMDYADLRVLMERAEDIFRPARASETAPAPPDEFPDGGVAQFVADQREIEETAPPQAWKTLYDAINNLMAHLGGHGEITPRHRLSSAVMEALEDIDGGTWKPEFASQPATVETLTDAEIDKPGENTP